MKDVTTEELRSTITDHVKDLEMYDNLLWSLQIDKKHETEILSNMIDTANKLIEYCKSL